MKINSEGLWKYVNELATGEEVTFGVYYDDQYVTEILWNGDNFEWESGRFNSEAFFNPLYDFIVIKKNNELQEIDIKSDEATPNNYYILNDYGTKCYLTKHSKVIADKVNEIIRKLKEMEK